MKVWYKDTEPTIVISFGKSTGEVGESYIEAPRPDIMDNEFYEIIGGILTKKSDSVIAGIISDRINKVQQEQNRINRRLAEIVANLPSWSVVRDEINVIKDSAQAATTVNQLKRSVVDLIDHYRLKCMRIVYLLAKANAND